MLTTEEAFLIAREKKERNEKIAKFREIGKTFDEIAKMFKISKGRVRDICCRMDRNQYSLENEFPTRIANSLRKAGISSADEARRMSRDQLLDIKNIGLKSVNLIKGTFTKKELIDSLEEDVNEVKNILGVLQIWVNNLSRKNERVKRNIKILKGKLKNEEVR